MAKSADELERELELKRQQLQARTTKLRQRVYGDVRGMRNQTQQQVSGYVDQAKSQVAEHPWLTLAGGLGGGIALGFARPPGGAKHNGAPHGKASDDGHADGFLARGFGALLNATGGPVFEEVRGTLQDSAHELRTTLQESVSDIVHNLTGNGSSNGASNASADGAKPTEHRQRVRDHAA